MKLSEEGIVVGQSVKKRLKLEKGDVVSINLPKWLVGEEQQTKKMRIFDFNWEPIGSVAYMPSAQLRNLLLTVENLLLSLFGILIGLPVGRYLVESFINIAQTEEQMELFSLKVVVQPFTYLLAAVLILVVVLISQIPAIMGLNKMNLAKSTKERAT